MPPATVSMVSESLLSCISSILRHLKDINDLLNLAQWSFEVINIGGNPINVLTELFIHGIAYSLHDSAVAINSSKK